MMGLHNLCKACKINTGSRRQCVFSRVLIANVQAGEGRP